jgi:hypothetical protein
MQIEDLEEDSADHTHAPLLSEFTSFPKLPLEIRIMVYNLGYEVEAEDRIVELTYEYSAGQVVSLSLALALLGVCRESRREISDKKPKFVPSSAKVDVYVDLNFNKVFIREDSTGNMAKHNRILSSVITGLNNSLLKNIYIDNWLMDRATCK